MSKTYSKLKTTLFKMAFSVEFRTQQYYCNNFIAFIKRH